MGFRRENILIDLLIPLFLAFILVPGHGNHLFPSPCVGFGHPLVIEMKKPGRIIFLWVHKKQIIFVCAITLCYAFKDKGIFNLLTTMKTLERPVPDDIIYHSTCIHYSILRNGIL